MTVGGGGGSGDGVLRSGNVETIVIGALIVLYTMISTSTANVAVITLPYMKSEFLVSVYYFSHQRI